MTEIPIGPEYSAKYELEGPDGTLIVFNDSTSEEFVGSLSPESSGLDSADVRESAVDAVEADGGIHGDFFYGRRPIILQGTIIASSATQRNQRAAALLRASNAMREDAVLRWTALGGEAVEIKVRRQQPVRITKGYVKEFQIPLVAADPRIYSAKTSTYSIGRSSKSSLLIADTAGIGTKAWTNPENAKSSNNTYATSELGAGIVSKWLQATEHEFSISEKATIVGVVCEIEKATSSGPDADFLDASVKLVKSGVIEGTDHASSAAWTTADGIVMYGAANDLWGLTLTPANCNAKNFGWAFAAKNASGTNTAKIDNMKMRVYSSVSTAINNKGNADTAPIIVISDTSKAMITIENKTTGQSIVLNLAATEHTEIEINFKNHTIEFEPGVSLYGILVFESSSWWELAPGENIVSVTSTDLAELDVTYQSAWL